jgi:AraC-like DNA-binding protein
VCPSAQPAGAPDAAEDLPNPVNGDTPRLRGRGRPFRIEGVTSALDSLRALVRRHCIGDSTITRLPGVEIRTGFGVTPPLPAIYPTMVCFVLQGAKRVTIGRRRLRYRGESYMLLSADLPVTGQVIEATGRAPYLAVSLLLEPASIAGLVLDVPAPGAGSGAGFGLGIGALTPDLQEPLLRLLRLLDTPDDIRVLAPLAERELLYRLLQGPHGGLLRQLAIGDSRLSQVRRAIEWIRADLARPLRVEALAAHVGLSPSTFHRHFKAVTGLSPLQYQKQIRLQEGRRRLLGAPGDVTSVALAVGYESTSQFTREYARLFGLPPARDAARLRLAAAS